MSLDRRHYDKEFKINAIQLYETSGKKLQEIERELGIGQGCLSHWLKDYLDEKEKAFPGQGNTK